MKKVLSIIIIVTVVFLLGYLFPIKQVNIYQRPCIAIVSRIYPKAQEGDVVLLKNGKVQEIHDSSKTGKCIGRIIFSTTEGVL